MSLKDFFFSGEKNTLAKKYLIPTRIIKSESAENAGWLLSDTPRQALIKVSGDCTISDGGYVVLDFGSELQGGVDITVNKVLNNNGEHCKYGRMRIVFGESVTEVLSSIGDGNGALNDHATRDMIVSTCSMSTQRYGNTGFRFVKIEAVGCCLQLGVVKGVLEYKDIEYKGSFRCNDERINRIFDTAAYTVHLNMQDYIWDGIKRDRLVWIGDMHPEVSTISAVFGHDECVERSLDFSKCCFPIDDENSASWMMYPSYSAWWITIHRDWYMQNGNKEYLLEQKEYMYKLINSMLKRVGENGELEFGNRDAYFVDWSSNGTPYMQAGFRGCFIMALGAAADIFGVYGDKDMQKKCLDAAENVKKIVPEYDGNKQVAAMCALSGLCDEKEIEKILTKDLLSGVSTFYGYYVLEALAKAGNIKAALDVVKGYWGAMLDLGATTFWEDFDIDWMENAARIDEIVPEGKIDVHASYGKHCYQKLRHSLCHGWASGPAPFLSRHILGVTVLEPGCRKVKISPELCDLEWVKGTYPTPFGVIEIEHRKENGRIVSKISAPDGVEIIK